MKENLRKFNLINANLKRLWGYLKKYKIKLLLFGLVSLIEVVAGIVTPIISARIIVSLNGQQWNSVIVAALFLMVFKLIWDYFYYTDVRICNKLIRDSLMDLQIDIGHEILKIKTGSMDKTSSGVFIQRMSGDVQLLIQTIVNIFRDTMHSLTSIGIFVGIFIINKIMFCFIVFSLIVQYFIGKNKVNQIEKKEKKLNEKKESVIGFIGELVRGSRDLKMLDAEDSFEEELNSKLHDVNDCQYKVGLASSKLQIFGDFVEELMSTLMIVLIVVLNLTGGLTVASSMITYNYMYSVGNMVYFLTGLLNSFKDFNLVSERVFELLDNKTYDKETFGNKHLDNVEGNFSFENVKFKYDENEDYFLNGLTFKIKKNETVAFVGKSGAGKTTIFNLLCKMYEVNDGVVKIDGVNINELDKESIRGNITIISQNPYIFNLSIKDNLKLVKKDMTDNEMFKACKLACLDVFIDSLPNGYDTIVGEGGINLSGGQKQRLAIARALIQNTKIILFDEATSALDNETQQEIQLAINNLKNDYTILIIAHRLSTIVNCDKIMVLDKGKIIASGKHKTLLKTCKFYKKLYETEITNNNK